MFGGNQHLPNRREVGLSSDELASRSIRTVRLSAFRIQLSLGAKAADTPKQPRPVASGGRTQRPLCSARIPSPDFLDHRARPPLPTPKRSFEHPTVGVMQQSSEPGLDGPFAAGTFTRASLAGRATRRCVRPPPLGASRFLRKNSITSSQARTRAESTRPVERCASMRERHRMGSG
jgi:hypothetical protein